jgi:signal transduction histidine kinase
VALPLAALGVEGALRSSIENIPFVLFFVVVSIVGTIGGAGPGVLSVGFSAVAGWWFQASSVDPSNRAGAVTGALVFVPAGLVISLLGALVRAGYREREDAARELSAAVRARDEFISVASHELKTPLTTLTLTAERLSRPESARSSLDEPSVARTVAMIARQLARLNVLVNNLLDVSRISSGRLDLELCEVDLADVVREVALRFQDAVAHAGAALDVAAVVSAVGQWDRLKLEQIVTNLLSNAIKYGQGGRIAISVSSDGAKAELLVSDTGIGIDPKDHARIFDRFERVTPRDTAGGFGLGLWIVREIATAHGGSVGVVSAPGQGARFTVMLPLKGPRATPATAAAAR